MDRYNAWFIASTLVFAMSVAAPAADQTGKNEDARKALTMLHESNEAEIEIGKLAERKGVTEQVKSFGKQLVQDHSAVDQKVQQVSQSEQLPLLSTSQDSKVRSSQSDAKDNIEKLTKAEGADFDKQFAKIMVQDHEKDIKALQKAEKSMPASAAKDLISQTIPKLQEHLTMARQIDAQLNGKSSGSKKSS